MYYPVRGVDLRRRKHFIGRIKMARKFMLMLVVMGLAGGCSGKRGGADMAPKKPAVASEMAMLSDMVGTWGGSWEITGKAAEEMRKEHPDSPLTFRSETTWSPYMGGQWYKAEGWYEMAPDLRATYVEYIGWSAKEKMFLSYFISDMGEVGHGTMRPCDDSNRCFEMKWSGYDMNGVQKGGSGCMKFVDRDNINFSWAEKMGLFKKMEMKGTSKRIK